MIQTPWSLIGFDITGPLKCTENNNRYVIVAIDYFTKFCVAKAIPDFTAQTTAKFLFEEIICRFGMPKSLVSDNGVNFKSILFSQLCKLCQIKKANSSFYHPPGNGLAERMVKTMKQIMTMYVDTTHTNWDQSLQASISAYNTSFHASIGCSPYEVLFARKPRVLADVMLSTPVNLTEKPIDKYIAELKENATDIYSRVNERLNKARERQKKHYDKFVQCSTKYKVNDLVLLLNEKSVAGESKSFRHRASGPHKILEMFNDVNYKIQDVQSAKRHIIIDCCRT